MVCPNKNLPEWKTLVEAVGEFEAYRDFFEYDGVIRTPEQVRSKIEKDKIKEGVPELFESNPELANAVYSALGFNFRYTSEKWKDDPAKENKATYINIKGTPSNQEFQIKKDMEDGFYSVHFKTEQGKLTKEQIQTLVDAISSQIPIGGKLSTFGEITKGGISGLNRFLNNGFKKVGEREIKDKEGNPIVIPILEKVEKSNLEQQAQLAYSKYLDTIFPNSKVKDIVYHASKWFRSLLETGKYDMGMQGRNFGFNYAQGASFALDIPSLLYWQDLVEADGYVAAIVNINNLRNINEISQKEYDFAKNSIKERYNKLRSIAENNFNVMFFTKMLPEKILAGGVVVPVGDVGKDTTYKERLAFIDKKEKEELDRLNSKKIINDFDAEIIESDGKELVIKNSEQIHILGSKRDIDGFKEFVDKKELLPNETTTSLITELEFWDWHTSNRIGDKKIITLSQSEYNTYRDNLERLYSGIPITKSINNTYKIVIPKPDIALISRNKFKDTMFKPTTFKSENFKNIKEQGTGHELISFYTSKGVVNYHQMLFDKISKLPSLPTYKVISEAEMKAKSSKFAVALYSPREDVIYITNGATPKVVLHELIHAVTDQYISGTEEWTNFYNSIVEHLKGYGIEYTPSSNLLYGLKNESEFIAEIFTNFAFMDLLSRIPAKEKGSVLDQLWDFILKFLGMYRADSTSANIETLFRTGVIQMRDTETLEKC